MVNTITATKGRPADANVIWSDQVDKWTWIGIGAQSRTVLSTEDGLMVDIYLGAGTYKRRLIIKLNELDLYDIEIGHLNRRTLEWVVDAQACFIYGDQLDQTIRDLYDANKV